MNNKLPTLSYLLLDPEKPFIHRDLSWNQFNDRVLAEARLTANPLLKRLKFLSISSSNLDEFFMIRFAALVRSIAATKAEETRLNLERVHGTLLESVRGFGLGQARTLEALRREAAQLKLHIHLRAKRGSEAHELGKSIFTEEIRHQLVARINFNFARISSLHNLQMLVMVNKDLYFDVPRALAPVYWRAGRNKKETHVFFLDDLIISHLQETFSLEEKPGVLRLTRDADFTLEFPEGDTESIPDLLRSNLGSRDRGRVVRLQYGENVNSQFIQEAADHLRLDLRQCFRSPGTLCLHGLLAFTGALPAVISGRPGMDHPPLKAMMPLPFTSHDGKGIFKAMDEVDFMLHHPYDSFDAFVNWLRWASEDPEVVSIEQTIYRTDSLSLIVDILKKAARKKKVRVALELRARFDESNNLRVAEELSKAGVEVKFGFGSLKLHAKVTLITKVTGGRVRLYTHLSTGNYNARTARAYTDISILTGNNEIGDDARHFFDSVFANQVPAHFKHLVIAPNKLHQKIRTLIHAETQAARVGKSARIVAKVNALVDEKIIEDLYVASQAGVKIELIVRGACSLIPGVPGLSENIRVISIVDRFLEHSRIYYFENSAVIYLSSADWMPRNFFSRLEIAFPVLDKRIYRFIVEVLLPSYLRDNVRARRLTPRGTWTKPSKSKFPHRAQWHFAELAARQYDDTPLVDHPLFKRLSTS